MSELKKLTKEGVDALKWISSDPKNWLFYQLSDEPYILLVNDFKIKIDNEEFYLKDKRDEFLQMAKGIEFVTEQIDNIQGNICTKIYQSNKKIFNNNKGSCELLFSQNTKNCIYGYLYPVKDKRKVKLTLVVTFYIEDRDLLNKMRGIHLDDNKNQALLESIYFGDENDEINKQIVGYHTFIEEFTVEGIENEVNQACSFINDNFRKFFSEINKKKVAKKKSGKKKVTKKTS